MRTRSPLEAADLGARLCQSASRAVYTCYLAVGVPVVVLCLASYEIADWLPGLALWWLKPWLDRTVLFVLARAAFAQPTTLRDLWDAQRQVLWGQLIRTLTVRRLSPWRSFTQPVHQLEGLSFLEARRRVLQIRKNKTGSATLMTSAFSFAELGLSLALMSLVFWFAPGEQGPDWSALFNGEGAPAWLDFAFYVPYALVILFLEPFYVAAGFAMYLNRRAELEAWDIEQEFRRAFPA
jgi:hypothetical protein